MLLTYRFQIEEQNYDKKIHSSEYAPEVHGSSMFCASRFVSTLYRCYFRTKMAWM